MEFTTKLLHGKSVGKFPHGSTLPPITQASAFAYESAEELEKVFSNKAPGFAYTRISNPTVDAFERRVCELEGGFAAVACSSGMAAITAALLNILQSGDEIIAGSGLFGGTLDLFGDLEAFGITTRFVKHMTADEIKEHLTDKTRVIFGEVIGNPGLDVMDVSSVAELAHAHGIPFIADSTTATPYLINPLALGADIVIHSSSKYINGSGNSISGVIIDSGKFQWDYEKFNGLAKYRIFGKLCYLAKLRQGIWRNVGGCLAPMNAYLNSLGLETLGLRMERCCRNSLELAKFFEGCDGIDVNYPALESSRYYGLCKEQLKGMGGAIITIRAGSKERAFKLINGLKLATNATNIGDVRTLIIHPASTIYAHSSETQKNNAGVFDDTIRISVGIEDIADLIDDFKQSIEQL